MRTTFYVLLFALFVSCSADKKETKEPAETISITGLDGREFRAPELKTETRAPGLIVI